MKYQNEIKDASDAIIHAFENGNSLYVCGNGGSAADSAHIVGELVKGFLKKRPIPEDWKQTVGDVPLQMGLPAYDLTAQGAVIAAINNDQGGEYVYAQQVSAYGKSGDVLLGISTSGNAKNILMAMKLAKAKGMVTIGLTGRGGGKMVELSDVLIRADETETYKVQEEHLPIYHEICAQVEKHFFAE